MNELFSSFSFSLEAVVFMSVVLLHLVKKNATAIWLYVIQSVAIVALLASSLLSGISLLSAITILATLAVKVFVAPYFFFRLIKKHQSRFSVGTYLPTPVSLLCMVAIVLLMQVYFSKNIALVTPSGQTLFLVAASSIFIALFLLINCKGVLYQMLGVLSLENSIVSFAIFAGLEQSPALQLTIIFNLLIWVIIANVFSSMIYGYWAVFIESARSSAWPSPFSLYLLSTKSFLLYLKKTIEKNSAF